MFKLTLLLGLMIAVPLFADHGNEGGHGGDWLVADFRETGRAIATWLANHPDMLDEREFTLAIDGADISSTDERLVLQGSEKDAINYPSTRRIVINRGRWRSIVDERKKWTIVLHEVLGLMERDDSRFQISSPIVERAIPPFRNAAAYEGTLPSCHHFLSIGHDYSLDGGYFGVELRQEADGRYTAYYVVGKMFSTRTAPRENYAFPLASGMTCRYSPYHAGAMRCDAGAGTWLMVQRDERMYHFSERDPGAHFLVTIRSPELAEHLEAGGFQLLETFEPVSSQISESEWDALSRGKIPQFKSEMSWRTAELFAKEGARAFGGAVTFDFMESSCRWIYPKRRQDPGL